MHRHKYISYSEVIYAWVKNRDLTYRIFTSSDEIKKTYKTSETIFILGSGPSLGSLSAKQWEAISEHDSFGINYSFLMEHVPTYHLQEFNVNKEVKYLFNKVFETRQERYRNGVWCCNEKMTQRFGHPRLVPFFFPKKPVCYQYDLPPAITLDADRPFIDKDFEISLLYRGTMTQVLELAINHFKYKHIVLLGVDLDTYDHFYSNLAEMREFWELAEKNYTSDKNKFFPLMVPKKGKERPIDEYLYALGDYLKRKRDVTLYTGLKTNMLYPQLPAYWE